MMRKSLFLMVVVLCVVSGAARCGDEFTAFADRAKNTKWGQSRDAIASTVQTLYSDDKILIAPATLGRYNATVNYLLNDQGKLYNLSWYTVIPVEDMAGAMDLYHAMVGSLTKLYRKPFYVDNSGKVADADKVINADPGLKEARAKMSALRLSGEKPPPGTMEAIMAGRSLLDVMPVLFYVEENYWKAGKMWVYTSLFCSTDGTCYVHLNFVSGGMTSKEPYPQPGGKRQPFSYSPLDRDQDRITDTTGKYLPDVFR
ncbi:MAG: hypothetical protein LUC93_16300 [Planctomycetaceae bacterium]|nr:hypothetical protein [Planctomycetaceae bacterium]